MTVRDPAIRATLLPALRASRPGALFVGVPGQERIAVHEAEILEIPVVAMTVVVFVVTSVVSATARRAR